MEFKYLRYIVRVDCYTKEVKLPWMCGSLLLAFFDM